MPVTTDTTEVSKSDRRELRSIVKGRFKLLEEEIGQREREIKAEIRKQIKADHQEALTEAKARSSRLQKRVETIFRDIHLLHQEMQSKGLVPGNSLDDYEKKEIRKTLDGWRPRDLDDRVREAFAKLERERGTLSLNLKGKEFELLERLSIDALETEQAKKFLAEIPNIDKLLPIPNGNGSIAVLTSGEEER